MLEQRSISWPGWETVRLIGRGSFGAVYEIQRDVFGNVEKAALKVISIPQNASDIDEMYSDGYDDESITSTFQSHLKSIVAEYSLMRKMNGCANIVSCDDIRYVQHDDGIGWDIFIKMDLLTPLTKALPAETTEETVVKIAKDLCNALTVCKEHNVIHRDIKPQNIFVSQYGDYKLGDFGIAKTVEKTMGGTKIGTYKYMAPEVYNNQPYGVAADIYSLGLVLYWLLNERRLPFLPLPPAKLSAGMEENARQRRFSGEPLPPPANGSEKLKKIVLKACAYDPKERYATAAEMLADLNGSAPSFTPQRPVSAEKETTPVVPPTPVAADDSDATVGMFSLDRMKQEEQTRQAAQQEETLRRARAQEALERQKKQAEADKIRLLHEQQELRKKKAAREEAWEQEKRRQKSKRLGMFAWILLVAAALAVIILAPWRNNSSSSHTPNSPEQEKVIVDVTLKVWAAQEDQLDAGSWLPRVERLFADLHPEYNITWDNAVCPEGDAAAMVTADPAQAADVYLFANDQLGTLVPAGALAKLDGIYLDFVQNNFSFTYQSTLTYTDGGIYGFPMAPNTWFMYYNKSILSEEDVKSLEACLQKGVVAFDVRNPWYLSAFFFANGCTLFGEQGNNAAAGVQFGGEAGYQAAARVAELVNNEWRFQVDGDGYGNAGLKDGTVAAYFSGSWDYAGLYEALGENLGAATPPTVLINGEPRQLKAYAGSKAVGVNPNSDYPEAAMEFAAFLASYESQLLRFQLRGITPALSALAQSASVSSSIVASAEIATMEYASFPQPTILEMNPVWGPMGVLGGELASGQVTPYNVKEKVDEMIANIG